MWFVRGRVRNNPTSPKGGLSDSREEEELFAQLLRRQLHQRERGGEQGWPLRPDVGVDRLHELNGVVQRSAPRVAPPGGRERGTRVSCYASIS